MIKCKSWQLLLKSKGVSLKYKLQNIKKIVSYIVFKTFLFKSFKMSEKVFVVIMFSSLLTIFSYLLIYK
jgi:hypothetical protein